MKKLFVAVAALFVAFAGVKADTSYLLIQGPFGAGGAVETFKWQVNYQTGALITGEDLLFTILGQPTFSGTYESWGSPYDYYTSGNSAQGASYIDFGGGSLFTVSFTLGSTAVFQNSDGSVGWNYYVAGGNGAHAYDNNGSWTYSDDGITTRTLTDGSFDAWVYGATFPADTIAGTDNSPTASNFSGATPIAAVPEPTSFVFLALGAGGLIALSKSRRS